MSTLVGMPTQYEMLVSHSPPVFSHSPPASFLSDYAATNRLYDPTRSLFRSSHHLSSVRAAPRNTFAAPAPIRRKMPTAPIRSCLAVKTAELAEAAEVAVDDDGLRSAPIAIGCNGKVHPNGRTKKRVVFADDQGYSLTEIRIMSEPSSVPPMWSLEFLAHVTQGMVSPVPIEQWTVSFRQPASDYLDFRRTLDSKNVSLENVIVKENDSCIVGTVKVRNLSFHKEVIVRTSSDGWKTQEDTFCTYATIGGSNGVYVLYDTFSFKLTLPPVSRKLEFCVCFRCDDTEYWDNNNNENYIINKRSTGCGSADVAEMPNGRNHHGKDTHHTSSSIPITIPNGTSNAGNNKQQQYGGCANAKVQNPWSEFASWNYESTGPYW